jgi:outer membrane receptor protein involved in Fe transport
VLGHHNISLGVDIGRRQVLLDNGFNSPGLFTFNGNYTNLAMSDFLLGNLYQFQQAQGQFENTNAWSMGFFIQDDYKVTPRLTLNLGLRWEPYLPWHEVFARVEGFSPQNYSAGIVSQVFPNAPRGLLFRGDKGFPDNGVQSNYKDFAPRVGFAWDVFGNGKTSLRGGVGSFYDSATVGIFNNNMVSGSPFALQLLLMLRQGRSAIRFLICRSTHRSFRPRCHLPKMWCSPCRMRPRPSTRPGDLARFRFP